MVLMMSSASVTQSNGRHMCVRAAMEEVEEGESVYVFRLPLGFSYRGKRSWTPLSVVS